jgi:two-component system, sensor histidine kinase RegB
MRDATLQTTTKVETPPVRTESTGTSDGVPPSDRLRGGPSTVNLLNFRWLTMLRWAAVVGQTLAIFCVTAGLRVSLPLLPVSCIILAELIANLAAWHRGRTQTRLHERELAAWVGFDLVAFTSMLYFTGGPSNPFSYFYIVHVAVAALTLHARFAWSLVLLSTLSFAALFARHIPIAAQEQNWNLHLHGLWVGYSLAASCVVYFLQRARATIEERDEELAVQRKLTEQTERLSSLATLAAGAAHELSSPLATIAVVSKDLALDLRASGNHRVLEDVELVRGQVERCRKILARLAHTAGEAPGELDQWVSVNMLLDAAVHELPQQNRVDTEVESTLRRTELRCPKEALCQALRVLLENAIEASTGPVRLEALSKERGLLIRVTDQGEGMSSAVLERVFEPFFTTKPAGKGMGLGLYLARNVVLSLHGTLRLRSRPGNGTQAELELPQERLRNLRHSSRPPLLNVSDGAG